MWPLVFSGVKIPENGPASPLGLGPVDTGSCPEAPCLGEEKAAPPAFPVHLSSERSLPCPAQSRPSLRPRGLGSGGDSVWSPRAGLCVSVSCV